MTLKSKPSQVLRTGMILGSAGLMLVIIVGGLGFGGIESIFSPWLINLGAAIALVGAALLVVGGLRYAHRYRVLMRQRRDELERMGDAAAKDAPAEQAELAPEKRKGGSAKPDKATPANAAA